MVLRSDVPKKVPVKRSYADLLDSLIKVNQERITALKKLYVLNSVTYGKDALRTNIENELEDYDAMQQKLMKTVKHVLSNLKQTPKTSMNQNDVKEVLRDTDKLFVLPVSNDNNKESHDEISIRHEINQIKNALRSKDSDNDSSKETENDNHSDSKEESKSTSLEKHNDKALNEVMGNQTQGRSDYVYEYSCGRGRVRCIKACKEAYRYSCDEYYCRSSLRYSLKKSCKFECKSWFY
ncbi:uncharacterized protein LOC120634963 isoform X2 [Pararge aegeria]|nr:uncharacterized protein LOC120634963 isoform X2 [Pararge aegeria]